jgi:twitching motility protein PilT
MGHDLSAILDAGERHAASDILLSTDTPVSFRVSGRWLPTQTAPLSAEELPGLLQPLLSDERRRELERRHEMTFSIELEGRDNRFRCHAFLNKGLPAVVLRPVPYRVPGLRELGLTDELEDLVERGGGLLLITSPACHGATTTTAALIDVANRKRRCHVCKIESPIEFVHTPELSVIEHREVGRDTRRFSDALMEVTRLAPDIVALGDVPDVTTMSDALRVANAGPLVIATMHGRGAVPTLERILDAFPAYEQGRIRSMLAASLRAVVSQVLIRAADGKSQLPALEVLRVTPQIRGLIEEQRLYQLSAEMESGALGMCTIEGSAARLVQAGAVTAQEAAHLVPEPAGELEVG